ncbi:MAG: BatA domain-containing protein, partial [Candidatus Aureabacteria bacterium]|nr:BatA domain-containing protein [Candidatus Auribacterota bacterium]
MRFGNIQALYLFWLLIGLVLFYIWSFRKRRAALQRFASEDLIPDLTREQDPKKQKLKVFLILLAVLLMIFSFLRPQWG